MDQQAHLIYEFGEFRLDAMRCVLSSRVDGQPLQVTGKVVEMLLHFVEHAGQLLDKRALMEALWPNVVVEESNLTQTIHTLRRTLGERPDEHRFIVTVPGRGYRFVADVRVQAGPAPVAVETEVKADRAPPRRWRLLTFVTLSLAAAGTLLFFFLWPGEKPSTHPGLPQPSIAVLPFVDMSPEGDQQYFSDGLSEEILNLLAQAPTLRVIARTSSFSFKGQRADIATIADKLKVTHVLEGSVRKSGERIRITAQLVDGATSAHVWSQTYDRDLKDIFGVQSEIAAAVAQSLQVTLTTRDRLGLGETNSPQAFEHYLQGRYLLNRRGALDVEISRGHFERALRIDPNYGRAWVGLAGAIWIGFDADQAIAPDALAKWREAVERALAFAPNLAEAHVRASQYYWLTGDTRAADKHFKRALALNPSDSLVLGVSAGEAILHGRFDEGISLQRSAVAVDPLSAVNHHNLGSYLTGTGQWEEAQGEFEKALELSPTSLDLNADIAKLLVVQQRFDEALRVAQRVPEGERRDQCFALAYHATGQAAAADAALARLVARSATPDSSAALNLSIGEVYAFRGDSDQAFKWLGLANRQVPRGRAVVAVWQTKHELQLSPFLRPLHADPRWQNLLASADRR